MSGSELDRGELLRPGGLRRDSVLGRPAVLLELLALGVPRDVRVVLDLHPLQRRDDSVLTVEIQGI